MEDNKVSHNNGVLTRNQIKMLSEKTNDTSSVSNESTKIKIKEKKPVESTNEKDESSEGSESLRSSISDYEFKTEEEMSSAYYSTEDEEELKRFEEEMLKVLETADKDEQEGNKIQIEITEQDEIELLKEFASNDIDNKKYRKRSKRIAKKSKSKETNGKETNGKETNGKETKDIEKKEDGEESVWETEEEEDIVDNKTKSRRNAASQQSKLLDTIRKLGKNYQIQPTYEVIIDDSLEQERQFKRKQKKIKNKFLNSISEERRKYIEECEKQLTKRSKEEIPAYYRILELEIPIRSKEIILKYMTSLENLDESSSEYHKFESFVDTCKEIPFGKYITLPKPDNFSNFLMNSATTLNDCIYGHELPKLEILQYLSQLISNPTCKGQPLGIYGPPGIGKTTLIQEGLSKVLGRPFYFISLGGCSDASFLDGHSFTYEGSRTGKIVDILRSAQCMNPIIYFDELDKISDTNKGEEISNLLVHLTDESQNSHFHDKYLHDIDLDLSKAFFVFSFNDIEKINPILRDRINILYLTDFQKDEKVKIAKNYLIPKIKKEFNMTTETTYDITSDMLYYMIDKHIKKEETGVRTLKKLIKSIYSKINMLLLSDGSETILELLKMKKSLYNTLISNNVIDDRELIDFLLQSNKSLGMDNYIKQAMYT